MMMLSLELALSGLATTPTTMATTVRVTLRRLNARELACPAAFDPILSLLYPPFTPFTSFAAFNLWIKRTISLPPLISGLKGFFFSQATHDCLAAIRQF